MKKALGLEPDLALGLLLKAEGDIQGAGRELQSVLDSEGSPWLKRATREELDRLR